MVNSTGKCEPWLILTKAFQFYKPKVTLKVNETNSFDSRKGKDMQIEKELLILSTLSLSVLRFVPYNYYDCSN